MISVITGVYCWRNRVTGKRYIGSSSTSIVARLRSYQKVFRAGRCHNRYLQRSWNKYGSGAFTFSILERCSPELCIVREQHWIDFYQSADRLHGYNLSPTAGSVRGMKFGPRSAEQRSQIASRMLGNQHFLGRTHTAETRAKLSTICTGRRKSPEAVRKVAESLRGRKLSAVVRAKMSIAQIGRVFTAVTRGRISAALIGRPLSKEHREKLSRAHTGKVLSESTRIRMSLAKIGKPWSAARRAASKSRS